MEDRRRKIIHIDADSFYASVEMREDPSLVGKPIAVGGHAERRGVIATSNYEARKFGVKSAMSSTRAMQLCPDLKIIRPHFELYREVSKQFHRIFREFTDLVEPLSLDEAYLDVTDCHLYQGSATLIAEEIRRRVREELHLTVSAGIAPNKFLAKVASDWNKPDGSFTVAPQEISAFVLTLPVVKINGVGKVTAGKLRKMGVVTCGDLQKIPVETLAKRFGKYGPRLAQLARGVDHREVKTSRDRKSISVENTYPEDIADLASIRSAITSLLDELDRRFSKIRQQYIPTKRYIKVKFTDFSQTTMEELIADPAEPWRSNPDYLRLLETAWLRGSKPVRLLGVGLRLRPQTDDSGEQLGLFP